jgi:adenylate cyclase
MPRVTYFHETTLEDVPEGQTLLDVSIRHRIPHLHQCGGFGRCTTCRVQILDGVSNVSSRGEIEQQVASRRGWDEFTRLACQTRVEGDVVIRRLLNNAQDIIVLDLHETLRGTASAGEGKELDLAILFADIRNFTADSEQSLPYDVVHMLNRYFTAAAEPMLNNNGFIDKYIGDGILAVFGTRDESPGTACRNAVRPALGMLEAVQRRGPTFEREFNIPLRIGIGIHFGTVILGRIGQPGKRQITVIGDTVNTTSRIERLTKAARSPIVAERRCRCPDARRTPARTTYRRSAQGESRGYRRVSLSGLRRARYDLPRAVVFRYHRPTRGGICRALLCESLRSPSGVPAALPQRHGGTD